ncbi:MAG: hypothetical protein WCQ21_10150 [Verrucomicrobiota bacterium]
MNSITPNVKPQFEFELTLRPACGNWQTEPEQRLRAALKRLLRTYGLRCTRCTPVALPPPPPIAPPRGAHPVNTAPYV